MDIADSGCPTAVLVDIPPSIGFSLSYANASSSTQCFEEDEPSGCKFLNIENQDSKEKLNGILDHAHGCKTGVSCNSSNLCEIESQVSVRKSCWQSLSPQAMSFISEEASKVIDHLNSFSIFDEDSLLIEETFPVPFNFDELDGDDTDQQNSDDDDVFINEVLDNKSSVCVQSLSKTEENAKSLNSHFSPQIQNNHKQKLLERNLTEMSFKKTPIKNDSTLKESFSCVVYGKSLGNSNSMICSNEVDDVSDVTHIAFEDKENIQNKKKKLAKKETVGSKTVTKNLSVNKSKLDQRGTLKNLSNIKQETSAKHISLTKNVTTPLKRMTISTNTKKITPVIGKPQMKKSTLSVDFHYLKNFSLSNSFQNTLISNVQKSQPTRKFDSGCCSLASDVKQQNVFATPSKRYSISTPLKSASVIKPPPAITSLHNFAFTRYTPQPVRPSRLSFSRSWQQSGDNSQFFAAKGHKQQSYIPSSTSKVASDFKNSLNSGRLSFSQSMSAIPVGSSKKNTVSTSTKDRFSSKLNLPSSLTMKQDKKLVRALFTNVSEK